VVRHVERRQRSGGAEIGVQWKEVLSQMGRAFEK